MFAAMQASIAVMGIAVAVLCCAVAVDITRNRRR